MFRKNSLYLRTNINKNLHVRLTIKTIQTEDIILANHQKKFFLSKNGERNFNVKERNFYIFLAKFQ